MTAEDRVGAKRRIGLTSDRMFFSGMGLLLLGSVFLGFAPTYYLKTPDAPALTPMLHVHGAVLTAWYLFYIVQTSLVSAGRVDLHRKLGITGLVLAGAVTILSIGTTIVIRGFNDRIVFSAVAVVMFVGFIVAGWLTRRDGGAHKRFMLLAMISLIAPAVARFPFHVLPRSGLNSNVEALIFLLPLFVYDFAIRRKMHPVTLWGGLFVIAMVPFRVFLKDYVF
jgi:hypothetical protein